MSECPFMSYEDFIERYPDFKGPNTRSLVVKALDEAELETDPCVFGKKTKTYHGLLAAEKLALSPYGRNAKMISTDGTTIHTRPLRELRKMCAPARRPLI